MISNGADINAVITSGLKQTENLEMFKSLFSLVEKQGDKFWKQDLL